MSLKLIEVFLTSQYENPHHYNIFIFDILPFIDRITKSALSMNINYYGQFTYLSEHAMFVYTIPLIMAVSNVGLEA